MTTLEAFQHGKTLGTEVYVAESMQTHPDPDISDFASFSVHIDKTFRASDHDSYEECFSVIAKMDVAAVKADRAKQLRAELAELEA